MKRESRNYAATLGLQEKCHHTFVALSNPEREGDHDQSRVTAGLPSSLSRCLHHHHPQQCPRLRSPRCTYTCWKHLMLSRMLNCCQRLEKLTLLSM